MEIVPINRIINFSNVDGPGNRMAIFFQTCPFRCLYCHNPETINACKNCGICVTKCPVGALKQIDGRVIWDSSKCVSCDTCIHVCPNSSSPKVVMMSVDDLLNKIKEVKPFIRGITVSGGECTNFASFLEKLFKEVKKLGLTCLIDSNGAHDLSKFESLIDLSDGVMLDVKAIDPVFHQFLTGKTNEIVLKNLHYLLNKNKLEEVRTVILPNYDEQNINTVKEVSKIIGSKVRYKLLKYRYFGVKDEGLSYFGRVIVDDDTLNKMKDIATQNGCNSTQII